jgi:hypothetical protein
MCPFRKDPNAQTAYDPNEQLRFKYYQSVKSLLIHIAQNSPILGTCSVGNLNFVKKALEKGNICEYFAET